MKADAGESYMKRKISTAAIGIFLTITTILSVCLCCINSPEIAEASWPSECFSITYTAVFSKTEILGNESFSVTIHGNATCINDSDTCSFSVVKKARVTFNVTAVHSGSEVILQSSGYIILISPFPSTKGQSVDRTVTIPLQFPAHGEAGEYSVIANIVKAEIYISGWGNAPAGVVPAGVTLGTVSYATESATPTPTLTPTPTVEPTVASTAEPTATPIVEPTVTPTVEPTATPTVEPSPTPTATPSSTLTINLPDGTAASWAINSNGLLLEDVKVDSSDGSISIKIPASTKVLGADMEPLAAISVMPSNATLPPVKGYQFVAAYDCGPDGASFDPGIELTLAYNPDNLPSGSDEIKLTVAYFDQEHPDGELLNGDITVDTGMHTVTFRTGHFSDFAILALDEAGGGSIPAVLPKIIAVGIVVLVLALITIVVIKKRRVSRSAGDGIN
jgi:hypothetical protein